MRLVWPRLATLVGLFMYLDSFKTSMTVTNCSLVMAWLDRLTPTEAEGYIAEGQFAPGSMLPKVQAAVAFACSKAGRTALITLLEKARDGIAGRTGTSISL